MFYSNTGKLPKTKDNPEITASNGVEDEQLLEVLSTLGIESLYEILHKEEISKESLWELSVQDLTNIGLGKCDQLKYSRAKIQWKEVRDAEAGKIYISIDIINENIHFILYFLSLLF